MAQFRSMWESIFFDFQQLDFFFLNQRRQRTTGPGAGNLGINLPPCCVCLVFFLFFFPKKDKEAE